MRVVRLNALPEEPLGEATPIAGWTGGSVTRTRQTIIPDNASDDYRCSVVNFSPGATTGWHAHTCDQILVVTAGRDRKSTRLNSSHIQKSRMPSSA